MTRSPGRKLPKVLIVYHSETGNTEKLAQAVAEGVKGVSGVDVEVKKVEDVTVSDIAEASGYAFGSPSHFSIMSGQVLTFFTNYYPHRGKMAGKPAAVFTTGTGGQVTALENVERILGVFNPRFIKPGVAVEGAPKDFDRNRAANLGKKLAKAVRGETN